MAGNELHVTHAAVSRHIKHLEQQFGQRLFIRGAFTQIQSALTDLSLVATVDRLVISVDPDFAGLWLVPRLADLRAAIAGTCVEIIAETAEDWFSEPRATCAIHYATAGSTIENGEVLFRSTLFPVCCEAFHRLPPLRAPEDLRHHFLLHDRSVDEWTDFVRRGRITQINPRLGQVFSETAHCLEAAARGQGVAIGDDVLASVYLSEGRLVKPFGDSFLSKNAYYFMVPDRAARHPSVDVFRDWLRESIEQGLRKNTTNVI